jgi:hypothetical protein
MHLRLRRFVGKNASDDDGSCNLCFLGQCSHIKDCSFFCCATVGTQERAATVIVALATAIVVDVASTAAAAVGGVGVAVGADLDVNAAVGVRASVAVAAANVIGTTNLGPYSHHFIFFVTYELFQ